MKGFRLVILFLVLALPGNILFAQGDSVMRFSLVDAQNYAISNFFESKNAALDVEEAKKKVLETTAIGLPQINGASTYQYVPGEVATLSGPFGPNGSMISIPLSQKNTTTYSATASQLIFSGEYIVGLQASKTYKAYSEENFEKKKIDVKESVAGSYFTILILKTTHDNLLETLNNLEKIYEEINKTVQVGLLEQTNADQLGLNVKTASTALTNLDNQISYLTKLFKYQLGLTSEKQIVLTDNIDKLLLESAINDSTYKFNLEEEINYQLLSTQEKLMLLNLNREKTTYLPTIAGFYQYSDYFFKAPAIRFAPKNILGVQLDWPLITSASRYAKVSEAKIELEKARNMKEQQGEALTYIADQAINNYRTALANFNNLKESLELSKKILDQATQRYKLGTMSSLDYTTTNNQYLQALNNYAMATQTLLNAKVALDKAYNKL
jgi:outer membrane protein